MGRDDNPSFAALDDFAALELERSAAISPHALDAKRQAIQEDRVEAIAELSAGVAELLSEMITVAERANSNRLLHRTKSPRVLGMIESSRAPIKGLYDALGLETDWESITATQWREAVRELNQWKNAPCRGKCYHLGEEQTCVEEPRRRGRPWDRHCFGERQRFQSKRGQFRFLTRGRCPQTP